MRGRKVYIWQLAGWPGLRSDATLVARALASLHEERGRMLAQLDLLGLASRDEATLECLTDDALRTSEIEGERLDEQRVTGPGNSRRATGQRDVAETTSPNQVGKPRAVHDATCRQNALPA